MRIQIALVSALALSACQTGQPTAWVAPDVAGPPDLSTCDVVPRERWAELNSGEDIAVPAQFADIVTADPSLAAVSTLSGSILCVDNSYVGAMNDMEWLAGERFLGWQWFGYEAFGYFVADRQDAGSIMDVGARPHFSPSGAKMASLQISDAGWGGMEGFAVWQVTPAGIDPLSMQVSVGDTQHPQVFLDNFGQWSFAGWHGEDCIDLSVDPYETSPPDPRGTAPRKFFAQQDNDWEIAEGECS